VRSKGPGYSKLSREVGVQDLAPFAPGSGKQVAAEEICTSAWDGKFSLAPITMNSYLEDIMKNISRSLVLFFAFLVCAAVYAVPTVNIAVKPKAGGNAVKQVKSDSNGNFTIGTLSPGAYALEFRASKAADVKNKQFSIAVAGITKSGTQNIPGDRLANGVAFSVEVAAKGPGVTGQIAEGADTAKKKVLVWVPPMLGSNLPGRWVEKGSAEEMESRSRGRMRRESVQNMQEKSYNPQN
jgi:hypothetical protein